LELIDSASPLPQGERIEVRDQRLTDEKVILTLLLSLAKGEATRPAKLN